MSGKDNDNNTLHLDTISLEDEDNHHADEESPPSIDNETSTTHRNNNNDKRPALSVLAQQRRDDYRLALRKRGIPPPPYGILGLCWAAGAVRADVAYVRQKQSQPRPVLGPQQEPTNPPYFAYAFCAVCTVLLVVSFHVSHWRFDLRDNYMLGPSSTTLEQLGALSSDSILQDREWYRLGTAVVLHAGLLHWGVNMLAILWLGSILEPQWGSIRSGLVFGASAVAANLLTVLLSPPWMVAVGASGGICGWLGAAMVDGLLHWPMITLSSCLLEEQEDEASSAPSSSKHFATYKVVLWLGAELAALFLFGWMIPSVDNVAHMAGLLYGAALAAVAVPTSNGRAFLGLTVPRREQRWHWWLRTAAALAGLVGILTSAGYLHHHHELADLPCRGDCYRYLSCAPFGWLDKACDPCQFLWGYSGSISRQGVLTAELICPYGEVASLVTEPEEDTGLIIGDDEIDWNGLCHASCDL